MCDSTYRGESFRKELVDFGFERCKPAFLPIIIKHVINQLLPMFGILVVLQTTCIIVAYKDLNANGRKN
jgi:hypothetical protein